MYTDVGGCQRDNNALTPPPFLLPPHSVTDFLCEQEVDFIIQAVRQIAEFGWKLLPLYVIDTGSGQWYARNHRKNDSLLRLSDLRFKPESGGRMQFQVPPKMVSTVDPRDYLELAAKIFERAPLSALELPSDQWRDGRLANFLQQGDALSNAAQHVRFYPLPSESAELQGVKPPAMGTRAQAERVLAGRIEVINNVANYDAAPGETKCIQIVQKNYSEQLCRQSVCVKWNDLSYTVREKKGGNKRILSSLNGSVKSGELLAILGPSGAGKSTLLDAIAGRLVSGRGKLKGGVTLNGKLVPWAGTPETPGGGKQTKLGCREYKHLLSYVPQDDALMGSLTVKETIYFAASFHANHGSPCCSGDGTDPVVEMVVDDMGLRGCYNTRVGDIFFKGISGGQKRRLSIGVEMVGQAPVLILDEPTSGLDSASAVSVMTALSRLAQNGHTVISTVHQPNSKVWSIFDKVLLLGPGGQACYFGATGNMCDHFQLLGHPCPLGYNPADFFLELINTDFQGHADVAQIVEGYKAAEEVPNLVSTNDIEGGVLSATGHASRTARKFMTLCRRNRLNNLRNPGVYWVRAVMYVGLSVMVGLMFRGIGDTHEDITGRIALLFYVAAFLVFMSVAVLPFFIQDRATYMREEANGAYSIWIYVLANFLCSLPGLLLIAIVSSAIIVGLVGLNGLCIFTLDLFLSLVVAESLMCLISALIPYYIIGIALGAGIFGMFMLTEGFMKVKREIPAGFIWLHYLGFHTYSFRTFMFNEFNSIEHFDSAMWPNGRAVLEYYDMADVKPMRDMLVLVAYAIVLQFLFYVVLIKKIQLL
jgi:ABC-type multidrug transport system ATPase subunit